MGPQYEDWLDKKDSGEGDENMDLSRILGDLENKDELIRQIEAELGKEFVPRTEFNAKNTEVKSLEKQLGELNSSMDALAKEKGTHEQVVQELTGKVKNYETASLKTRIAHELGIPLDLAGRLTGEDEKQIREDAETLAKLIDRKPAPPPLKSNEPQATGGKDSAYKALLNSLKGE